MSTNPNNPPNVGGPPPQTPAPNVAQDLIQNDESAYGSNFKPHLLDQYKIYVEMADRISARRMLANTFFLTVNTAVIAALAAPLKDQFSNPSFWLIAPFIALIILCYVWKRIIHSYRQLNSEKYMVIGEIEKHLPSAPYSYEWKRLGAGVDHNKYLPLTHVEDTVPKCFIAIYGFAITLLVWKYVIAFWGCIIAHIR